jgi:hypothetical protein
VTPQQGPSTCELRDVATAKGGTLFSDGAGCAFPSIPPAFAGTLAAGTYTVRAASASAGEATLRIAVRAGDVTRQALSLDGPPSAAKVNVAIAVKGTRASQIHMRAFDRNAGKVAFDGLVDVVDGVVEIADLPIAVYHFDFLDDAGAMSCYDIDVTALFGHLPLIVVVLDPHLPHPPSPEDTRFAGLPPELGLLTAQLPELGVRSVEQLAAVESEALLHRMKGSTIRTVLPQRLFSTAVEAARAQVGLTRVAGEQRNPVWLDEGARFERALLPRAAGDAKLAVHLPAAHRAELTITRPDGTVQRHEVQGSQVLSVSISIAEATGIEPLRVALSNLSPHAIKGELVTLLPDFAGVVALFPSTQDRIEQLYRALAVQNPGIGTTVVPKSLEPENIQSWLDRARAFLAAGGVCSLDDLGKFRLDPPRLLHTGAYVAPLVPPADPSRVAVLAHYAFSEIVDGTVVYYRPNDLLHETAVVLAGEWDITGQSVIVAQEVRAGRDRALGPLDAASRITWQMPRCRPRSVTGRIRAARQTALRRRQRSRRTDGDQDPAPSRNGGGDAATPARS